MNGYKNVYSVIFLSFASIAFLEPITLAHGQEKIVISRTSESIVASLISFGIDKGLFRHEGLDVEYRTLRADLSFAALAGGKDVDYLTQPGTVIRAALAGFPAKVLAISFSKPLLYLMSQPNVQSVRDLKGKKFAVSSVYGTAGRSARAALQIYGLDPDKEITFIVTGDAAIRMAAMETKSVEASIMPLPWNVMMKRRGYKELMFTGKLLFEPFFGIVTSTEKIEKNRDQVRRVLRAFFRSMIALRQDRKSAIEFFSKRFKLELNETEEVYTTVLESLTEDGTVSQEVLLDYLDRVKKESGVKKAISLSEIVDFQILREATKGGPK